MRHVILACCASLPGCCGLDIPSNVDACNGWLSAIECGAYDFSTVVDCAVYDDDAYEKCDISGYFDCLSVHTTCDEVLGVATVDTEACADEAVCE